MLKYFVAALLLSTSVAHAEWFVGKDGIVSQNLSGRCSRDTDAYLKLLDDNGYKSMMVAKDLTKFEIHSILYNFQANEVAFISETFDKSVNDKDSKMTQVCLNFIGTEPYGDGPTFKQFILHQRMDKYDEIMKQEKEMEEKHKEEQEGH